jgi:hypothetical protein
MTTSGTYTFNPSLGSLTIYAFQVIGVRPSALLQEHMESARMSANLLLGRWSSQGVNLWKTQLNNQTLTQGVSTYSVPSNTITVLDAYITVSSGGQNVDRIILPVSRTEYASYPNKAQQGFPTTFWYDRLLSPTITLWPVPDGSETSLNYYTLVQIQDANLQGGKNVEIPYYWLEAFAFGLAARLAMIWAPDKAVALKAMADESYQIAASQNVETAQQYISPQIASYFR